MLSPQHSYDRAYEGYVWSVPDALNIGVQVLDAPAALNPSGPAIIDGYTGETFTFGALADEAARLCGALERAGAERGDRVAVIAPQGARTLVVQAAILRAGLVSVPLSERYGRDALSHRLRDSGCRFAFVSNAGARSLAQIEDRLDALELQIALEGEQEAGGGSGTISYAAFISGADAVPAADTAANEPALMIYTSGTTGAAKGALHGHRVLAGHMPGFLFAHGGAVDESAIFYTPADWAWAGGLLNLLFPALSLGRPVVAFSDPSGFKPEAVAAMLVKRKVTHAFLPPTALKLMRAALSPDALDGAALCSVMSAGEALGRETFTWAEQAFGFPISEAYGQTEANLVIGSSAAFGTVRPGATGKPVPGHRVYVVREDGTETSPGDVGEIAVGLPDPVAYLSYWNAPEAARRKVLTSPVLGDLLMTGDMAMRDMDGFIWFVGRDDDVITSSGHRIGPGEIEDCLAAHEAVSMAAVVGVSDPVRTQIIRAFVVLREGFEPSTDLADALRAHVRANLAAHEYPRDIRFLEALPMTTTGKVIRRMLKSAD